MRTIKFRLWDIKYKYMRLMDDLDLMLNNDGIMERHSRDYIGDEYYTTDQYIIEQFTGLLDQNGKEIYEGDIIKQDKYFGTIVFWNGCFSCKYKNTPDDWENSYVPIYGGFCEFEVIGNIHENPELLENVK